MTICSGRTISLPLFLAASADAAMEPMSNTDANGSSESPADTLRTTVTQADYEVVDIDAPLTGGGYVDAFAMYRAFEQACMAAKAANDEASYAVYRLFANLCALTMNPSDPATVWHPYFVLPDGSHSPNAEDFRGAQTALLSQVVPRIRNPALRARIADIAWSNNRRDGASAVAAIDAYCAVVTAVIDGSLKDHSDILSMQEANRALQRAIQIAALTTKRGKRPENIKQTFDALYVDAKRRNDISTLRTTAELGIRFELCQGAVVAAELEATAAAVTPSPHPLAVRAALDLATQLYNGMNDKDGMQRCMKAAVEQTLAMRAQVGNSAMAEAQWVMDALQRLNHVVGMEEREQELELELRRLQKSGLKQMGAIPIDLELGNTPEKIGEHFGKLSLSDALRYFAILDKSRDPDELKANALEMGRMSPLVSMLSVAHIDAEGRTQSRSDGAPSNGEPSESWFRRMIAQAEGLHRVLTVRGKLEPARLTIQAHFGISDRHFTTIVELSAFVPESQKPIVVLGLTRFFQGDHMSATHLLIPQLEPCLRHVLKLAGHDPSKRRPDSTEEDRSIRSLFETFHAELEAIFGVPLAAEIDNLFNLKPGPALRHEVAHGQLSASECFSDDAYYANWLIYRLCALPVMQYWDDHVAPMLATEE